MGPRDSVAKLTDFRTSHGDARTHWAQENGTAERTSTETPETHVWGQKAVGLRNPDFKQTNKVTRTLCHSFKLNSGSSGYWARAGGRSRTEEGECALPRPTRGIVKVEGRTRPQAQARRGGASGGGALRPLTPTPVNFGSVGPSVQLCFLSLPFDAFKSLQFLLEQSYFLPVLTSTSNNLRQKRKILIGVFMGSRGVFSKLKHEENSKALCVSVWRWVSPQWRKAERNHFSSSRNNN